MEFQNGADDRILPRM